MEPKDITCPECEAKFYVVWNNMAETQGGPENCPFCGEPINYAESVEKEDEE